MAKDKYPNDTAVQLMVGAERKMVGVINTLTANHEGDPFAAKHVRRVRGALYMLREARFTLSDQPHLTGGRDDDVPF